MSQFDYPRINFLGRATVSPCTANNVTDTPLIYYDPIQVKTVIPPRVFLSGATFQPPHTLKDVEEALPAGALQQDGKTLFFTIDPIRDKPTFDEWVITPLGACALDADYHRVYPMIKAPVRSSGGTLQGAIPGYWNYFGDETFRFQDVRVVSIALPSKQGEQIVEDPDEDGLPSRLAALLGADLVMDRAFMVDITPSTSSFTQIFCKNITLKKADTSFFSGVPLKGNLRTINAGRIVNQQMPESGSGDIFTTIPIKQLEGQKKAPLIRLFKKYGRSDRKLKGLFIRYNLFENEEIRPFDYRSRGKKPNPAQLTVAGSISPWYKGEMRSMGLGRQLVHHPQAPNDSLLPPVMTRMDYRKGRFQVDLLNSLPETFVSAGKYDTYPLGNVEFRLLPDEGKPVALGSLEIGPDHFNRAANIKCSGLVSFPLDLTEEEGRAGCLAAYRVDTAGRATQIMREEEYTLFTDQAALYGEAGDDPVRGYHSYSGRRQPCRLRVHYRGEAVRKPAPFTVVEFRVEEAGAEVHADIFRHTSYKDKDLVSFPTHVAANAVYLFLPGHTWQIPHEQFAAIFITGYAVHVRILPRHDYGRYLNPQHPDYPTPIDFEVLYREIFEAFDLAYPAMGQMIPFTKKAYDNAAMAQQLIELTKLENWGHHRYMPVTRDLSQDQRALIRKWAAGKLESQPKKEDPSKKANDC